MKLLLFLCLVATVVAQLMINTVQMEESIKKYDLGVDGDVFNVKGLDNTLKCPDDATDDELEMPDMDDETMEERKLDLNKMWKCLNFWPAEKCAEGLSFPEKEKLAVRLIEGDREDPSENTSNNMTRMSSISFIRKKLCTGMLFVADDVRTRDTVNTTTHGLNGIFAVTSALKQVVVTIKSGQGNVLTTSIGSTNVTFNYDATLQAYVIQGSPEAVNTILGGLQAGYAVASFPIGSEDTLKIKLSRPDSDDDAVEGEFKLISGLNATALAALTPAITTASPSPVAAASPIPVVQPTQATSASATHSIVFFGTAETANRTDIQTQIAAGASVAASAVEIMSLTTLTTAGKFRSTAATMQVLFRFIGLSASEATQAATILKAQCTTTNGLSSSADCASFTPSGTSVSSGGGLGTGALIGIILGIIGAIGLVAVIGLVCAARSTSKEAAPQYNYTENPYKMAYNQAQLEQLPYPTAPPTTPVGPGWA
eukprot:NODE_1451_length_1730_cov_143.145613_g1376_i0.p1 GENE.NODE_1451_length_1730_cov_143.145613_g1376_i0~~NODE_1451_length_1730_cov_143.145613_g1376_i0.p1  ORF type:complete len:502 (+),score=169.48 NODE_1451_length_1730_cov_143.145613_g1376_i0:57-1508(+)